MRKRNRNVVYALMYGAGKKTALRLFMRNKQNRRMPARLRKKEFSQIINMRWDLGKMNTTFAKLSTPVMQVHDEVVYELPSKRQLDYSTQ